MCTALTLTNPHGQHFFGRNMDLSCSFGQSPTVVPRNFSFPNPVSGEKLTTTYAMIGMATVVSGHPLFAEATNEHGLACAGLNFPQAVWEETKKEEQINIAPYDLIPYVLGTFKSLEEALPHLQQLQLVGTPVAPNIPLPTLHWMLTDTTGKAVVIEKDAKGLHVFTNPVGVLTNAPSFDWHLFHLQQYMGIKPTPPTATTYSDLTLIPLWSGIGGVGLPGDATSPSRFIRAAFLRHCMTVDQHPTSGITEFFHILQNVAMVNGAVLLPDAPPDITLYTSCICLETGTYYYNTYSNPQIQCVRLHDCNLDSNTLIVYPYASYPMFDVTPPPLS